MSEKEVIISMDGASYLRFKLMVEARERRKEAQNLKNHAKNPNTRNINRDSKIKWNVLTYQPLNSVN